MKLRKKILRSALLTTIGTALLFTLLIMMLLFRFLTEQTYDSMRVSLYQINTSMRREEDAVDYLRSLTEEGFPLRVTLIGADGGVDYESGQPGDADEPAGGGIDGPMDNHMDREEIRAAAQDGYGESSRLSLTLNQQSYYAALRLEDGSYLRLSETRNNVIGLLSQMLMFILPALLLVCAGAACMALWLTRGIVRPINALNPDSPEHSRIYPELQPLLDRMIAQNRSIQEYILALNARRNEFDTITAGMAEGLIVLNTEGGVLSINRSAQRIFHAEKAEGMNIMELSGDEAFLGTFRTALNGLRAQGMLEMDGRHYRLLVNPVYDSGHYTGLVAIMLDITDNYLAEQNRREFTANVSHELKTPLTSIAGYAEIMKSGIAAREDWQELIECIYREASRMIRLVEDILHLSRLDSGACYGDRETIDLYPLAQEIAQRFEAGAAAKSVTIRVLGGSACLTASRQMLDEILSNLISNAVKYNREGGKVWVEIRRKEGLAIASVRDNGIGISPEHQERIFERFFRVDKSRSKAYGGTGLGLSIVKHAVQQLGGSIRLRSALGEGTEISVSFPVD